MAAKEQHDTHVLVTGASGFIAIHIVSQLLEAGYKVRGTVRSLNNPDKVAPLWSLPGADANLELVEADLMSDKGWNEAVAGETLSYIDEDAGYSDENDLIRPAVEGTRRVLQACARAGVKRVVLTSSVAAIFNGHENPGSMYFTDRDWSVPENTTAYEKSKTLAEREAWKLAEEHGLELTTINPGFVLGPMLSQVSCTSAGTVCDLLMGSIPAIPDIGFAIVDVRDVACAHIRALERPESIGRRFICANDFMGFRHMGQVLENNFGRYGYKPSTSALPSCLVPCLQLCYSEIASVKPFLGVTLRFDNSPAREVLGIQFRDTEQAVIEMAFSCIRNGLVPDKSPNKSLSSEQQERYNAPGAAV